MSEGSGSGEDVDREDGSDEDQFEEAADQVADGAAGQAAQSASTRSFPFGSVSLCSFWHYCGCGSFTGRRKSLLLQVSARNACI